MAMDMDNAPACLCGQWAWGPSEHGAAACPCGSILWDNGDKPPGLSMADRSSYTWNGNVWVSRASGGQRRGGGSGGGFQRGGGAGKPGGGGGTFRGGGKSADEIDRIMRQSMLAAASNAIRGAADSIQSLCEGDPAKSIEYITLATLATAKRFFRFAKYGDQVQASPGQRVAPPAPPLPPEQQPPPPPAGEHYDDIPF